MILAIDIHYYENSATAAGVLFEKWSDSKAVRDYTVEVDHIEPYQPGEFYKREMPCILELLKVIEEDISLIVVDGYVTLGEEKKPGLGMHLYSALNGTIPIIGVAKNFFHGTDESTKIYRGTSTKPLFVTSVGIDNEIAKCSIISMPENSRNPLLLKRVDQLCRGLI